jgi:hypothetical protein
VPCVSAAMTPAASANKFTRGAVRHQGDRRLSRYLRLSGRVMSAESWCTAVSAFGCSPAAPGQCSVSGGSAPTRARRGRGGRPSAAGPECGPGSPSAGCAAREATTELLAQACVLFAAPQQLALGVTSSMASSIMLTESI